VRVAKTLLRGIRRRCPRCGEGALFRRWIDSYERCAVCGLQYQRNHGDLWIWLILTDRIPMLVGIVAMYFGFRTTNWIVATAFFAVLIIPLIATMRERQGLAIALDYISRVWFPDPSDEIHASNETSRPEAGSSEKPEMKNEKR
jgi:uncharacterized protein (DUF983 family)